MLLDPHIHTKGISLCSQLTEQEMLDITKEAGVGGIVLTNHYRKDYLRGMDWNEWILNYRDEYLKTKAYGESIGVKVLFGVEATLNATPIVDYIIYGLSPEDVVNGPVLYELDQKGLYEFCHAHQALLIQAHPYRLGAVPQNPAFLDGIEINCHPGHQPNQEKNVREFAKDHSLLLTCGSDFHGDTFHPTCGIWVPDEIETSREFAEFLRQGQPELLTYQFPTEY